MPCAHGTKFSCCVFLPFLFPGLPPCQPPLPSEANLTSAFHIPLLNIKPTVHFYPQSPPGDAALKDTLSHICQDVLWGHVCFDLGFSWEILLLSVGAPYLLPELISPLQSTVLSSRLLLWQLLALVHWMLAFPFIPHTESQFCQLHGFTAGLQSCHRLIGFCSHGKRRSRCFMGYITTFWHVCIFSSTFFSSPDPTHRDWHFHVSVSFICTNCC